jgi:cytochrome P450
MTAVGPEEAPLSHKPLIDLDPAAIRRSHLYFRAMREGGRVYPIPELDVLAITRYDDVLAILRNPELFSSAEPTGPQSGSGLESALAMALDDHPELMGLLEKASSVTSGRVLVTADPPVHTRQRSLVGKAFSPRRVAAMETRIRVIADGLIDDFASLGNVELVREFAVPLPLIVIAEALGVPKDDLPMFKRWSDHFVAALGNPNLTSENLVDMIQSQSEFADYFSTIIEERRADPHDDLITDIVQSNIDGQILSDTEMLGMFAQFLVAGNETTTKLMTSTIMLLLDRPELFDSVRKEPDRLAGVIEESLRLEGPVQCIFRKATTDTELAGVPIAADSHLMLAYASANRDPDVFADPDHLNPERENAKTHLGFGQGPHFCLGASLARAEARIGLDSLIARLDGLRYAPENTFEYEPSYLHHGLKELHLEFRPGSLLPRLS